MDISKTDAKVCVRVQPSGSQEVSEEVVTFGAMTRDVLELRDWLVAQKVTCVAMEATGSYWKPYFYLLEDLEGVEVMLVNPHHIKQVPGRKTDVADAVWIAEIAAHGLVRGSFVPQGPVRQLRELTRARTAATRERTRWANRLETLLEDTGVKLSAVVSDLLGVSGRRMLQAMADGERDPYVLADLADYRLKADRELLADALTGRFTDHHGRMVKRYLTMIDTATQMITDLTDEIDQVIEPFRAARDRLTTIPGISTDSADVIIAETGGDMTRFPSPDHLVSWAGCAPGHNESAGRAKPASTRPGNKHLTGALGTAVMSISRSKTTRLGARYRRISARRGPARANVAVQHTMLIAIWHILTNNEDYTDLGVDYYTRRAPDRAVRNAIHLLQTNGYDVAPTAA